MTGRGDAAGARDAPKSHRKCSRRPALLFALSTTFSSCPLADGACQPSRSQSGEERIVNDCFFNNKRNGTFVELGALDGVQLSNTLMLDTCLGWRGVLVEGSHANFQNLQRNVRRLRRHVSTNYGAVCAGNKTSVKFTTGRGPTGGDVSQMSESFVKRWHGAGIARTVTVPCKPMSAYVQNLRHIDFFSLDIEGAELEALVSLNFSAITVDIFMIELDDHNEERNRRVRSLLAGEGYTECVDTVPRSGLFVHGRRVEWAAACAASCGHRMSSAVASTASHNEVRVAHTAR